MAPSAERIDSKIRLKSRYGCIQCKRRKIKCDEVHPTCRNCKRFEDSCQYTDQASQHADQKPLPSTSPSTSTSTGTLESTPHTLQAPTPAPDPPLPSISHTLSGIPLTSNGERSAAAQAAVARLTSARTELELMHHFTAFTSTTLFDTPEKQAVFQQYMPKMALDRDYLIHAIFAVTAMHISDTLPAAQTAEIARYCNLAAAYHGQALAEMPADLERAVERDFEYVFAISGLIAIYSYTLLWQQIRDGPGEEDVLPHFLHWVKMTRGVEAVVWKTGVADRIMAGRFEVLFRGYDPPSAEEVPLSVVVAQQLDGLCQFADWSESGSSSARSAEVLVAYYEAVDYLRQAYRKCGAPLGKFCRVSATLSWPVQLKPAFVQALTDGKAPAKLIAMHFCVLMHRLKSYWWIDEGPAVLCKALAKTLPENVRGWATWPLECVGD